MWEGIVQEALDDAEAVGAAVEGEDGVAFDFGAEGGDFGAGDVGEIGDDDIEIAGDLFEEVAAQEFDVGAEARGIEAREIEGVFADVGENDFAERPGFGQAEANAAGTGGHVEHAGGCGGRFLEHEFHQRFGFGAWDQGAVVAHKFMAAEFDGAEQMLQRLPFPTAAQQLAQRHQIRLGDGFTEAQVKVEPTTAQNVGEEMLHVQPGFLDLAFLQVGGAGADDFEDELHERGK